MSGYDAYRHDAINTRGPLAVRDESPKGILSGSPLAGDIRAGEQMAVGRTHDVVERLRQRFS